MNRADTNTRTYRGSCLCGGVTLAVKKLSGPVEICHCNRCRKKSGAGSITMVTVALADYVLLSGEQLIQSYAAPILYAAPAYRSHFCRSCGSPTPPPQPTGETVEVPAGIFDDDPGIVPDKHIYTEFSAPWDQITDDFPRYTIEELATLRGLVLPADFAPRSHYDL